MEKGIAFATMITDDSYLPGVQLLNYTLRKYSKLPMIVIVSSNVKLFTVKQIQKLDTVTIK